MKKYLKSGFNTTQNIKLEAGTYSLVAYVKSLYGNTYTFALGYDGAQGVEWTEYDVDVVKNQLCKVWFTFTIREKITKLKPISSNFSASLPVYVADLQLTRGNVPVESGASPFDFDEIINDLHDEIDSIEDFTNEAFKDGLLSREEKTQLRASLDAIGSIVESVKGSYNKLLDNPFIHENTMDSITARYYAFIASWISDGDPRGLKPVILWIVNGDNIVDQNERDEKDRALNAFNDALYAYNQAEKEVYNDVGENSIAPIIDENGMWSFWSTELQEFIPSEFSAEGDEGHSPYIDVLTGTWWEWSPELGKYKDTFIKAEGDKGDKGEDGITISQNQQGYTYRADLNGDIIGSLADGMVKLTITSGSTPITCPSYLSGTPTENGTYRVTITHGNEITTKSSLSSGKYRITPEELTVDEASVELEIKVMMDGVVTSYPLTLTYRKQFDGADGKSTEFIFKGSTSDTTAPTLPSTSQQDDWYGQGTSYVWNDDLIEPTKTLPYVWASQRKKVNGVWGAFMPPKVWLRYSDGITSTTIHYAKSESGTAIPTSGWGTSVPSPTQGWYLWTRTTTTYKVAVTTVSYSVAHWAKDGDGIVSTTIEYAKSSSGTTIPTSGWDTLIPSPTKGWYLWTRTTTVYKTSPTTVAYTTSYWANDGKDGIDGEPPKISSGYPKTQYAIGDSKTIYPTIGWGVAIIDVTESKPYLWSRQEIKYDSGDTLYTGYLMLTNITPVSYMAGEWDLRVAYTRNDKSYPIVTYKKGTNNRPLYYYPKEDGVIEYKQFVMPSSNSSTWYKKGDIVWYEDTDEENPVPLGLYESKANSNRYAPASTETSYWKNVTSQLSPQYNNEEWVYADGVDMIIADALMANFGKIASAVFSGDHMISQYGENKLGNQTNSYKDFGKVDDDENPLFTPNIDIDFLRGVLKALDVDIRGTINATSGSIGDLSIVDGELTANHSYMTYLPNGVYVEVTGDIKITSGGIIISNSYGGTTGHPDVVQWNIEITSAGVKVGNYEIKRDGFYQFGNRIELGAGDYIHPSTHPASMITTGTFPGIVKAQNNTSYTTKQVRNMILSTNDAISSQMANGDIWIKYE